MGWGICFNLDKASGRVYCQDGCNWKATATDYEEFPVWPSARESVLEYFERDAHRELDMIRDECPGTATALAAACEEHIGSALGHYDSYSDEKKTRLHEEKLKELEEELKQVKEDIKCNEREWRESRDAWRQYQKEGPPRKRKAPKTRAEEIRREMEPMEMELAMEDFAVQVDKLRRRRVQIVRDINREKLFTLE